MLMFYLAPTPNTVVVMLTAGRFEALHDRLQPPFCPRPPAVSALPLLDTSTAAIPASSGSGMPWQHHVRQLLPQSDDSKPCGWSLHWTAAVDAGSGLEHAGSRRLQRDVGVICSKLGLPTGIEKRFLLCFGHVWCRCM